jgi:hypothetical protein
MGGLNPNVSCAGHGAAVLHLTLVVLRQMTGSWVCRVTTKTGACSLNASLSGSKVTAVLAQTFPISGLVPHTSRP